MGQHQAQGAGTGSCSRVGPVQPLDAVSLHQVLHVAAGRVDGLEGNLVLVLCVHCLVGVPDGVGKLVKARDVEFCQGAGCVEGQRDLPFKAGQGAAGRNHLAYRGGDFVLQAVAGGQVVQHFLAVLVVEGHAHPGLGKAHLVVLYLLDLHPVQAVGGGNALVGIVLHVKELVAEVPVGLCLVLQQQVPDVLGDLVVGGRQVVAKEYLYRKGLLQGLHHLLAGFRKGIGLGGGQVRADKGPVAHQVCQNKHEYKEQHVAFRAFQIINKRFHGSTSASSFCLSG